MSTEGTNSEAPMEQSQQQQQPQDRASGEGAASAYARMKHQRDHHDRAKPKDDQRGPATKR